MWKREASPIFMEALQGGGVGCAYPGVRNVWEVSREGGKPPFWVAGALALDRYRGLRAVRREAVGVPVIAVKGCGFWVPLPAQEPDVVPHPVLLKGLDVDPRWQWPSGWVADLGRGWSGPRVV